MTGHGALQVIGWTLGVGACVAAIYGAAGAALERPAVLRIDVAVASGGTADYSTDGVQASRPPLDPEILGAIASDESALARPEGSPSTGTSSPERASGRTIEPRATITPPPTATSAPTDTPEPKPSPSSTTEPELTATDTPEPEPTPTDTPQPEPTPTNTPKHEPSPTSTPIRCRTPETVESQDKGGNGYNGKRRCPTPTPEPDETKPPDH